MYYDVHQAQGMNNLYTSHSPRGEPGSPNGQAFISFLHYMSPTFSLFTLMLLLVVWCVLQSTTSWQCWYSSKEVFELWCPKDKRREPDGALVFTWRTLEPFTGYYWPSVIEPDLIDTWSKHLPAHTDLYTFRKDFIRLKPGAWHLQKMHRDEWFSLVNRKLYMSR